MLRGKEDGYSVGLVHVNPQISASVRRFQTAAVIDNTQQYGSLGYTIHSGNASVDYTYPSTETPKSYETGGVVRRYHTISTDTTQHYLIGILPTKTDLYNDAMVETYLNAISFETPQIADVDLDAVYEANMELYALCAGADFLPAIQHEPTLSSVYMKLSSGRGVMLCNDWMMALNNPLFASIPLELDRGICVAWMKDNDSPLVQLLVRELGRWFDQENQM